MIIGLSIFLISIILTLITLVLFPFFTLLLLKIFIPIFSSQKIQFSARSLSWHPMSIVHLCLSIDMGDSGKVYIESEYFNFSIIDLFNSKSSLSHPFRLSGVDVRFKLETTLKTLLIKDPTPPKGI